MTPEQIQLAGVVSGLVHMEKWADAARLLNDCLDLKLKVDFSDPKKSGTVLQTYLHFLLNAPGGMTLAAGLLWTPNQFTSKPQSVRDLWTLIDEADTGLIMGAASMGKSFSVGARFFLEWIRDPIYTSIKFIGPSKEHLEANLFSHIVSLHKASKLPLPGEVGELYIGLDRRDQLSAIRGVIIPIGHSRKAGRLQGTKRKPRTNPHPIFGPLSRLLIFIDEIENVPGGLWKDIDNVLSNSDSEYHSMKLFGAYNPTNQHDEVAKRTEPVFGWGDFDADTHFRWKSKRGWEVLRLDGEKSENVIQGKVIYPGLQTREGLETIAKNAGGRQAGGYLSMGRGAYPEQGTELVIVPMAMALRARGEAIWYDNPNPVAGCDVALEGRDTCSYSLGKCGLATGVKYPPNIEHPNGYTIMFKDRSNQVIPRWLIQLDQQFPLPKAATPEMKDAVISVTKRAGVKPEYFAIDRTGIGTGVADFVKSEWSSQIYDINYSAGCSEGKRIMAEDAKTCDEDFSQMCSQLWFMLRAFLEFGNLLIHPSVDTTLLFSQITTRRFRMVGKQRKAESKRDYMSRESQGSPGEADSLTLMCHAAWAGSGVTPSMKGTDNAGGGNAGDDDDWYSSRYPGGVIIDETNRTDVLDDRVRDGDFLTDMI